MNPILSYVNVETMEANGGETYTLGFGQDTFGSVANIVHDKTQGGAETIQAVVQACRLTHDAVAAILDSRGDDIAGYVKPVKDGLDSRTGLPVRFPGQGILLMRAQDATLVTAWIEAAWKAASDDDKEAMRLSSLDTAGHVAAMLTERAAKSLADAQAGYDKLLSYGLDKDHDDVVAAKDKVGAAKSRHKAIVDEHARILSELSGDDDDAGAETETTPETETETGA